MVKKRLHRQWQGGTLGKILHLKPGKTFVFKYTDENGRIITKTIRCEHEDIY